MAEGATTPNEQSVISIITSQTVALEVMPSADLESDPPVEPSDIEKIEGDINRLQEQVNSIHASTWYTGAADTPADIAAELSAAGYTPDEFDIYLNADNGNVYQYLESNGALTWQLKGSIRGEQGEQGEQGAKGERGEDGDDLYSFTVQNGDLIEVKAGAASDEVKYGIDDSGYLRITITY